MNDAPGIHARPKIVGARDQAHRGSAAPHRARRLYRRPPGVARACMSRSGAATSRMRASGHRLRGGARRRRASSPCSPRTIFDDDGQAAGRHLAHGELLRDADLSRWRAARCAMSASRSSASLRKAATRPKTRVELIAIDYEPLPHRRRSGTGGARRRAAAARGGRHQRAGQPRIQARRCRCRVRCGGGARSGPLSHASQDAGRDRAARLPRRIRRRARAR